jgi:3-oxoacyl-[acyl-carrier protein] reductase
MNTDRFSGKSILITGGAGGLGSAIARSVMAQGGKVGILDTNSDAIQTLVTELIATGGIAAGQKVDVRDSNSVTVAVNELAKALGSVDVLIAAAGGSLGTPRDLDDISDDDFDLVLDVNVKGTFNCARAVIPHMKKAGGGSIVTFSSIGGRSASPVTGVPYATAKAAILGLTRRLAKEVGGFGIRVNAIAPGLLTITKTLPVKNLKEFIEYAKAHPNEINYASSGNGTVMHLNAESLKSTAGFNMVHIPYKGSALAIPDLISGKVHLLFGGLVFFIYFTL